MSTAFPQFRERFPWFGGDLQTLHNWMTRRAPDVGRYPGRRLVVDLADGTGDRLAAMLNRPLEKTSRPLAVLVHGLTGWEDSVYIRRSAGHLLEHGFPVLRLNLRGAGPSRPLCRWHYHAGRSEDLFMVLSQIEAELCRNGVVLVGYSLGGNMLLKFLAEAGKAFPIRAAASVSAPIDLQACSVELRRPRNRVYQRWLLTAMKEESLAPAAEPTEAERRTIASARTLYEFDNLVVAPRNGFRDAEDYYARSSAQSYLAQITVPTLIIHAGNDPWIPGDAYARVDWSANPRLTPLLSAGGGHVGFHGVGDEASWHDRCVVRFFEEQEARGIAANAPNAA
ncbi:MAG: alpha/beta fold hydrolase [Proteobacteria bacterium]|nr:alpha/beta fold hydrolase [Pseudomonadota bacterium]MBI3499879.1 alpha/beta fold hydrolase [Pseudomonadota bacterium]